MNNPFNSDWLEDLKKECIDKLGKVGDNLDEVNDAFDSLADDVKVNFTTTAAGLLQDAIKKAYEENGIEKYEVIALIDDKTCRDCVGMDRKIFSIGDYDKGVTAPPFHFFCRCTTRPWVEGEGESAVGKAGKSVKFDSLDEFINNPKMLEEIDPINFYNHLSKNGYNPTPLSRGSTGGIPFEQGGGFKVNWNGNRLIQYHPGGGVHSGSYWKISSGTTGTTKISIEGNYIP